jgi:hypothetical protein
MSTFRDRSERLIDEDDDNSDYEEELQQLEDDLVVPRRRTIKDRDNPLVSLNDKEFG